jgi:hypothetical protein
MWRDPLDELIERPESELPTGLGGGGCSLPSFTELQWVVSRILSGTDAQRPQLAEEPRVRMVMDRLAECLRRPSER